MTVTLIIGTQWGDEGKGKVVDYYSKDAEYVVRFQGGNNAGHTIKVDQEVYKLHIVPSGVIQGKIGVIGNGVVIDPEILINEIDELTKRSIKPNLLISDRAHIIMPYHKGVYLIILTWCITLCASCSVNELTFQPHKCQGYQSQFTVVSRNTVSLA